MTSGAASGAWKSLWVERLASLLRLDTLADRLHIAPTWGPYLFVILVYIIDLPLLGTIGYLQHPGTPHGLLNNPLGSLMVVVGLLYGVWATRRLHIAYHKTVQELPDPASLPQRYHHPLPAPATHLLTAATDTTDGPDSMLQSMVTGRFKLGLYGLAIVLYLTHLAVNPTSPEATYRLNGPLIASIKVWVIVPILYMAVVVDFAATYLATTILLPLKVRHLGLLDFRDPLGYGHLRPIGTLLRTTTTHYFIGLTLYAIWVTSGVLTNAPYAVEIESVITTAIAGGTLLGILLFLLPVVLLHTYITTAKTQKLEAIASQIRAQGPADDPHSFPETRPPTDPDHGHAYTQLYIDKTTVENTHDYPIDITHLQEIAITAVLPALASYTTQHLAPLLTPP